MSDIDADFDLPSRLTASWPPAQWSGVHVLAAVSGGADSMALLRALVEAKRRAGGAGHVLAGHVNHQLRSAASDADERWLCQQCRELGVRLEVRREDAATLAAAEGDGLEAAARSARYRLLTEMAERAGARFVVTAHTRDDQAETVLFRLLRGAGLRGLAGMRRFRKLSPGVVLARPLLDETRAELEAYLHGLGQPWREDASNANIEFARNRLRHELLPYVREHFNADADAAINRAASLAAEAQSLVEKLADELLARCIVTEQSVGSANRVAAALSVAPLRGQPAIVVREALRQAWRRAGLSEQSMTHDWWRQLAQLASYRETAGKLNLPGNVLAQRQGDLLVLSPPSVP
jgi:tRNA(Ile)-lysidine synthase